MQISKRIIWWIAVKTEWVYSSFIIHNKNSWRWIEKSKGRIAIIKKLVGLAKYERGK